MSCLRKSKKLDEFLTNLKVTTAKYSITGFPNCVP